MRFQYRVFRYLAFVAEHSADLAAFPARVAVQSITVFGICPAPGDKEAFAVFAFLDEDVMLDHLYELEAAQVGDRVYLIQLNDFMGLSYPIERLERVKAEATRLRPDRVRARTMLGKLRV